MTNSRGLRLLCLDGGGVRGLVQLSVLRNLKRRTNKEPHELFDLLCGSGTGGILAMLLGLLKVPVDECEELYEKLAKEVFEVGWLHNPNSPVSDLASDLGADRARHSSKALERCMKEAIQLRGHAPGLRLSEVAPDPTHPRPTPRVFVVARRGQSAHLFRNYDDTIDAGAAGTHDACVWEAARATSATPELFEPVKIGRHRYVDGGLGHNNPTPDALTELSRIGAWKDHPIACIVSLGTGIKTINTVGGVGDIPRLLPRLLIDTATDCEATHQHLENQRHGSGDYFRFNVSEGVGDFGLDGTKLIPAMIEATQAHLARRTVIDSLEKVWSRLVEASNSASL